ncbi:hypothetical protein F5X97DRAFT_345607 [Nemania serpens]|nr:hypothetical protein F5X97DRAFT_345607 [Nemania serpens]
MVFIVNGTRIESLEDKLTSTVHTIVEIAFGLGATHANLLTEKLHAIERNTREVFWWTSWAVVVILGMFILNMLVKVRTQLVTLNGYQSTFQRMWAEDRANDDMVRREEKREREIRMRRGLDPRQAAREVHFPDTEENEEYEAWVADMRDTVGAEYDD